VTHVDKNYRRLRAEILSLACGKKFDAKQHKNILTDTEWHQDIIARVLWTITLQHASVKYIDTNITNDTICNISLA